MDLLDENRSLIYTGKLLRQPDTGLEWGGWTELFVLLFDNYRRLCLHCLPSSTDRAVSGDDETKGKRWYYEVPRQPKGTE